jgi:hypothetical protein
MAGSVEELKKKFQESIKVSLIVVNNIIVKKVSLQISLIAVNVGHRAVPVNHFTG